MPLKYLSIQKVHLHNRRYRENHISYTVSDYERILHAKAFRRLQYKTQVVINDVGDHYKNRMTHSLEVANIAKRICDKLELNSYVAECISLIHDIGHSPFGHSGERALQTLIPRDMIFDHNIHGFRILTQLEKRNEKFLGLNLSAPILEGFAKHNGAFNGAIPETLNEYSNFHDLSLRKQPSLEAQISSIADDIAYLCHDIEDAIRAETIHIEDIIKKFNSYTNLDITFSNKNCNFGINLLENFCNILIEDIIECTKHNISSKSIHSIKDLEKYNEPLVFFSPHIKSYTEDIRSFLFENFYTHNVVREFNTFGKEVITYLFKFYVQNPFHMNYDVSYIRSLKEKEIIQITLDFIAGMTDRYAIQKYEEIKHKKL